MWTINIFSKHVTDNWNPKKSTAVNKFPVQN